MNIEKTGEHVFGNVDKALAEKIISRSMENCVDAGTTGCNDVPRRRGNPALSLKTVAMALAILTLVLLLLRRETKK